MSRLTCVFGPYCLRNLNYWLSRLAYGVFGPKCLVRNLNYLMSRLTCIFGPYCLIRNLSYWVSRLVRNLNYWMSRLAYGAFGPKCLVRNLNYWVSRLASSAFGPKCHIRNLNYWVSRLAYVSLGKIACVKAGICVFGQNCVKLGFNENLHKFILNGRARGEKPIHLGEDKTVGERNYLDPFLTSHHFRAMGLMR
ncbi:hypothetical protein PoB_004202700 [Plakobranchus ocellatus]|uniref:Uncharacterized protein n=1 Tax=Plakobranchus ocellatus TaxID=259542 RepID=A0AAV4B8M1_9GAST|nr:hypothetical protein PoB_004202700 [Plakobranchus ocellatus]